MEIIVLVPLGEIKIKDRWSGNVHRVQLFTIAGHQTLIISLQLGSSSWGGGDGMILGIPVCSGGVKFKCVCSSPSTSNLLKCSRVRKFRWSISIKQPCYNIARTCKRTKENLLDVQLVFQKRHVSYRLIVSIFTFQSGWMLWYLPDMNHNYHLM